MSRTDWLHGWGTPGAATVLIGTAVHCVGCGRFQGITTVAFTEEFYEWAKGRPNPDWPFPEDACPLCNLFDRYVEETYVANGTKRQVWLEGYRAGFADKEQGKSYGTKNPPYQAPLSEDPPWPKGKPRPLP